MGSGMRLVIQNAAKVITYGGNLVVWVMVQIVVLWVMVQIMVI
jgi:hypothetical protein